MICSHPFDLDDDEEVLLQQEQMDVFSRLLDTMSCGELYLPSKVSSSDSFQFETFILTYKLNSRVVVPVGRYTHMLSDGVMLHFSVLASLYSSHVITCYERLRVLHFKYNLAHFGSGC